MKTGARSGRSSIVWRTTVQQRLENLDQNDPSRSLVLPDSQVDLVSLCLSAQENVTKLVKLRAGVHERVAKIVRMVKKEPEEIQPLLPGAKSPFNGMRGSTLAQTEMRGRRPEFTSNICLTESISCHLASPGRLGSKCQIQCIPWKWLRENPQKSPLPICGPS